MTGCGEQLLARKRSARVRSIMDWLNRFLITSGPSLQSREAEQLIYNWLAYEYQLGRQAEQREARRQR